MNSHIRLIVGIGASSGGLEAFESFFRNMPGDAGMAFIVVQHLAPDHKSALPELLAQYSPMPVVQAGDGAHLQADHIYTIPPNTTLTVVDSTLRVAPPAELRGHRTPIDIFFRSLAEDQGENAVCIVMSGSGTDGTLGLRSVKEHGGMAMAQTIESAKYDAILRSAIATGLVDHLLTVDRMPEKLLDYAAHLDSLNGKGDLVRDDIRQNIPRIHELLRNQVGHDFRQYKENTIARRLERRMKLLHLDSASEYLSTLETHPEELNILFKDLLIGVTQFFRDPAAFAALAKQVIPKLFESKEPGDALRVCVVGCASGEEAYSLGILLCEYASTVTDPPGIKIFATDIDERGLATARKGLYPKNIFEHVNPERIKRFFTEHEGFYRVNRDLRDLCIFSKHSFIKDAPFSRLDLITCRNVMIYLELDLQQKILPIFHYALKPGGFLFLGAAENVNASRDLFRTVDKNFCIFLRRDSAARPPVRLPIMDTPPLALAPKPAQNEALNLTKQLERVILESYGPACVAVNEFGDCVYISNAAKPFLQIPSGRPDSNVFKMIGDGLRIPLRTALQTAISSRAPATQRDIAFAAPDGPARVDITVSPLSTIQDASLFMAVFNTLPAEKESQSAGSPSSTAPGEEVILSLEKQLIASQLELQTATEDLETSNEELRSTIEEYQSTNQELETSKEELQSINEEMETVNAELNHRLVDLDRANSDLQNLLDSTQIATIFLDRQLQIRNFTPSAASIFRLRNSDIGRPITDLMARFNDVGFEEDLNDVLHTLWMRERDVNGLHGTHYLMRILPYRSVRHVIEGLVVTFIEVTQLKRAEQLALDAKSYAEDIVATVREPLLVLDDELRVRSANDAFYQIFEAVRDHTEGHLLYDLGDRQWDIPELRRLMDDLLPKNRSVDNFVVEHKFATLGSRTMVLNARRIHQAKLILLAIEDITDRKRSENLLHNLNSDLKAFSHAVSHDLQQPLRAVTSFSQLLARNYRGKLDDKADVLISHVVAGAQQMETLLSDMRDYWSVNEEHLQRSMPVNCEKVLSEAMVMLEMALQESSAIVSHDPLPTVLAEEVPIAMVFRNLIGNAIKYSRPGEPPRVHISAETRSTEWQFAVKDNGIGIPAQYLEMIFIPFKRLHGSSHPGSGIGLAICKKIVNRFGGRIWVESTIGQGSTFYFTICR